MVSVKSDSDISITAVEAIELNASGDSFFYGDGCACNRRKAVGFYRKAAELGYDVAQYNLGYCYEEGLGVLKSGRKASHWYRLAAEQGNAKAQNNLGNCYAWGYGVQKDLKEAFNWYSRSAAQGYHWGEYNLAECYDEGFGVKKNRKEAMRLYALSAAQGNADAARAMRLKYRFRRMLFKVSRHLLYILGTILFVAFMVVNYYDATAYEKYLDGVEAYKKKDYDSAVTIFREAIELGSAEAVNHLGLCYERGHGVEKSDSVAYEHYVASAKDDCYMAMYNIGRYYERGRVVAKDVDEAVKWYRKAARMGELSSQKALKRLDKE